MCIVLMILFKPLHINLAHARRQIVIAHKNADLVCSFIPQDTASSSIPGVIMSNVTDATGARGRMHRVSMRLHLHHAAFR